MTLRQAFQKAQRLSEFRQSDAYVVFDEDGWGVTDENGLESFYLGARVEAHYLCGEYQQID